MGKELIATTLRALFKNTSDTFEKTVDLLESILFDV
jgi:hypothetical protein